MTNKSHLYDMVDHSTPTASKDVDKVMINVDKNSMTPITEEGEQTTDESSRDTMKNLSSFSMTTTPVGKSGNRHSFSDSMFQFV